MPRPLRQELAGGVFHVFGRGNRGRMIFRRRADRRTYLTLLGSTVRRFGWRCLAYCLMGTHVHLLLETPEPNLGRGMQHLHGRFAQRMNVRYREKGHFFESRYGCVRVEGDGQLWMTARYIARNPVAAGLCARAEDYEWSSYGAVLREVAPDFLDAPRLLSYFEAAGGQALGRYQELVAAS